MADVMFRIVKEDRDLHDRKTLKAFCMMLRRILKESVYDEHEIEIIHCYLLRGITAEIHEGIFRVIYEKSGDRFLLGLITAQRSFIPQILDRYFQVR
jgi:hypothetical protein